MKKKKIPTSLKGKHKINQYGLQHLGVKNQGM